MRFVSIVLIALVMGVSGCAWFERGKPAQKTKKPESSPATAVQLRETKLPLYISRRASNPIVIDGVLDETSWRRAVTTGRFTTWNDRRPTQFETQARVLWDEQYLYIAFICEDGDISATMTERDANLWEEHEICEVFIDPGSTGRTYYEFGFTPLNAVDDLIIPDFGAPRSLSGLKCWDCKGMRSAVKVDGTLCDPKDVDMGWTVEVALPILLFSGAPHLPPKPGDTWRINFYRWDNSFGKIELQAWSPTFTPTPDPHVPSRFGILKFAE